MYAVIFKAHVKHLDKEYIETASRLRELAKSYGCTDFVSCTENKHEIAISYWNSEEQIKKWKLDPEHIKAQELGKSKWYESYTVEIVNIQRTYHNKKQ